MVVEEQELDSPGAEVLDSQIVMAEEDMCGQVVDKMEDKQAVHTILEGHMKMEEVEADTEPDHIARIDHREERKLEEAGRNFHCLGREGEEEQALEDHSLNSQEEDKEVDMVVHEAGTNGEAVVRTHLEVAPVLVEDRDHLDPKHLQEEGGKMMTG